MGEGKSHKNQNYFSKTIRHMPSIKQLLRSIVCHLFRFT